MKNRMHIHFARRALLGFVFGTGAAGLLKGAQYRPELLSSQWAKFAGLMNAYIEGLNSNVNDLPSLRSGIKAWREMEKSQGWDSL